VKSQGAGDEDGLKGQGLVIRACEEEIGVRGRDGLCYQWYQGGVGDVEGAEYGEGVGGVALDAGYCAWERG
jgi:hypothetical protein